MLLLIDAILVFLVFSLKMGPAMNSCFFEAGCGVPTDLADVPIEETMVEFLVGLQRALQSEELILFFTGSKGAGPLLALLMCLCPEDIRVEVEGELIH